MYRGAIPGGAQGAQAPPKLGGRKLRILQKGGLKPPYIHHILEKWRFSSPSELLCQKNFLRPPNIWHQMAPLMITLTCLYIQNKDNFMVWIIYCNWENTMKNIIWNLLRIICVHIWVKIVECKLEYLGWHVSYQELKIMAHWFQSQMRWKDSGFNLMNTWSKIAQNIIFKGQIIYKSILR